jgi:hypothetical protein
VEEVADAPDVEDEPFGRARHRLAPQPRDHRALPPLAGDGSRRA